MKFLHLGDLHLGKSLGDFDLIEDQRYILEQIQDIIKQESVDAVLIAGDVFDKSIPSEAAVNLLNDFLYNLKCLNIKTFIISGNHDSDDRLNYGSKLFETSNIYIAAVYGGTIQKQILKDKHGEICVYLLPFVKASQVRHYYPDAKIDSYDDAVKAILEHTEIDAEKRNIIVAHQYVTGRSGDPQLGGSEGIGTQSVGNVEKIGSDCFDAFDYVALGHIHSPQRVGREEVRYSGSPLKYSLSEVNNEKSVPLITFGKKGDVQVNLIPLTPLRDLRHLKGKLRTLLDNKNIVNVNDFIYATLTDESIIQNAMSIFQDTYPNTVKIDFDNSHTRQIEQVDISGIADNKSFPELISDFYRMMYGCEISEEEMGVMREVAQEVGLLHKAD
ncbi:MAG: exonuclease SbcCD subunit D [Oscillospiraceae bacterium]|nr:exonuclease SbcCD subunit D [Oscillospiraceae bacterium]